MASVPSAQVLVVGAGPTGLTIATELARRGISVRVVDKAHTSSTDTRALGVQARSLELLERQGVVESLLARGLRADRFNIYSEGRRIVRADLGALPTAYPYLLMVPQNETEDVIADRLAELGVSVERATELVALRQDENDVTVELELPTGAIEVSRFDWAIGADGAHSVVRKAVGIDFVGTSFDETFAVADLRVEWDRPHEEFFAFLDRGRFAAFFPMLGGWHRVAIAQPTTSSTDRTISETELQSSISRTVPGPATVTEVRQAGLFHINQRRAESHRRGRVFLVGDAAHIHSVVGAQGMNTGIQDAFNLGWKLDAVIRGAAGPGLLDTYADERAAVARRLVSGTRRITRMALLHGAVSTGLRRRVAPLVLGRPHVQRVLTRAVSQIDVSYHRDGPASPRGRAEVGDRAPDAELDGPVGRVHECLDPLGYTALAFGPLEVDARARLAGHGEVQHVADLPLSGPAAAAYGVTGPEVILVRPDGYIAARGDARTAVAHLESIYRTRTTTGHPPRRSAH